MWVYNTGNSKQGFLLMVECMPQIQSQSKLKKKLKLDLPRFQRNHPTKVLKFMENIYR